VKVKGLKAFHGRIRVNINTPRRQFSEFVIIRAESSEGVYGYGECPVVGYDPFQQIRYLEAYLNTKECLDKSLEDILAPPLRFAIGSAKLDIEAKLRSVPLRALLGRTFINSVHVNALMVANTGPEALQILRTLSSRGFDVVKIKVGHLSPQVCLETLDFVLSNINGIKVRIDANGMWDINFAIRAFSLLERYAQSIDYIEQPSPISQIASVRSLRKSFNIRIAIDESLRVPHLLPNAVSDFVDVAVVKPSLMGSPMQVLEMIKRLEGKHEVVISSYYETSIGTMVLLQIASVLSKFTYHGLSTVEMLDDDVTTQPLVAENGVFHIPSSPGLGLLPDKIDSYAVLLDWRQNSTRRLENSRGLSM